MYVSCGVQDLLTLQPGVECPGSTRAPGGSLVVVVGEAHPHCWVLPLWEHSTGFCPWPSSKASQIKETRWIKRSIPCKLIWPANSAVLLCICSFHLCRTVCEAWICSLEYWVILHSGWVEGSHGKITVKWQGNRYILLKKCIRILLYQQRLCGKNWYPQTKC